MQPISWNLIFFIHLSGLVDFNVGKTKEMIISNKQDLNQHPALDFNMQRVTRVNTHMHLGILLSNNLKWTAHIDELVNKTKKRLSMMRGLMYKVDRESLETIYTSFIRPCLEYGNVLFTNANEYDLAKLDTVQLEALRITVGATARCNLENLYNECTWPSLSDRRSRHCLITMYKIVNGHAPQYLQELLPDTNEDNFRYQLRNNEEIRVPFARLEIFKKSSILFMITAWNQLDITKKRSPTVESFKRAIHQENEPKKEILYYGCRWASIHHSRIRVGCSKLNYHLCNNLHVIPSPRCQCGYEFEDPRHFFFNCPIYQEPREKLFRDIAAITDNNIDLEMLLYGDNTLSFQNNKRIFDSIHLFLNETKRFE